MRLIDADELKKALAEMWYESAISITGVSISELIDKAPTIVPSADTKSCGVSADKSTDQKSADVPSGDLISREDAIKGIQDGYCACVSDCIDEINKLPNMGTDCTDFIDWIRNVVADEELWELNAVGYGEIICRKLVKIGALATTEKLPYYYIPSADRQSADVVHKPDYSYEADMVKRLKEATSGDRPKFKLELITDIVRQLRHLDDYVADTCDRPQVNPNSAEEQIAETCDRPKGEWKWTHGGQCSECGFHNTNFDFNFCPHCGADMRPEK